MAEIYKITNRLNNNVYIGQTTQGVKRRFRQHIEKALLQNQQPCWMTDLRGRSIRNAIIISSEAENLTKEHIQLLLGRVDKGSNLWMDADLKQRDRAVFEKSAGIETMIDRLKDEKLFGYVHLVKSERSETARLADKLN